MNHQIQIEEGVPIFLEINNVKLCAVQLNLKNCSSYNSFLKYIEFEVFSKTEISDLYVFPENINLSLLFAKDQNIESSSVRTFYETLVDKFLSILDLSFVIKYQKLDDQKSIILDTFKYLAKKYNCNIITGSFYEKRIDGVYNVIYAIDRNGNIIDSACKKDLVGIEKGLKIKSKAENKVVNFDFAKVGLSICFDLNDKEYCSKYKCDILVAPSNGFRPFPGYPFDRSKETPQIQRAQENDYIVIRPYCAGWLGPLYFSGRSMIVDKNGDILAESKSRNDTELLITRVII